MSVARLSPELDGVQIVRGSPSKVPDLYLVAGATLDFFC
jgi:hypothetical protein